MIDSNKMLLKLNFAKYANIILKIEIKLYINDLMIDIYLTN